jgi:hypothetical protein
MNGFGSEMETVAGMMQDEFCADRKSISKVQCNAMQLSY